MIPGATVADNDPMRRARPSVARVAAVLGAVLLAACGSTTIPLERAGPTSSTVVAAPEPTAPGSTVPGTDPTTTVPATTTTTAPALAIPVLEWSGCGDGAECTTFAAPLDYADPTGPTIEIAVSRRPATGDRIGALVLNFGGPGGEAHDLSKRFGVPSSVRARFDIIGMDPRGVGRSTALSCGFDAATLYTADPTMEDQADRDAFVEISERYVDDCATDRGDLLPHLGTRNVARDMDLLRAGLGDETINFLGFSYGSSIGQVYAELFPTRVRAMVIDGIVDTGLPGIDQAVQQSAGFETALANWAAACPGRSTCPASDPIAAVDQVLAAAESGLSGGRRVFGPGEAAIGLAYPLYNQRLWDDLDRAIGQALGGNGAGMVDLADGYASLIDFSIYFAVSCLDATWPADIDSFFAAGKAAEATSPRFGEAIVNDYGRCALWPAAPDPIGAVTAAGAPPIVVVSGTGDPATPYENGVVVADRLASGVLVTFDGEGHTVTFQGGSTCIDNLAAAYFVDLTVPADRTTCT